MSEEMIIRNCAPTLSGLKTGSMFSCPVEAVQELHRWNARLYPRGIRVILLRQRSGRALLYLFRPEALRADLNREETRALLMRCGYTEFTVSRCLMQLMERLREEDTFPHEIGLFLGYPPEDVQGFMDNHTHHCKCSGCWKVYGNVEAAKQRFAQFRICTEVYAALYACGVSLERLMAIR